MRAAVRHNFSVGLLEVEAAAAEAAAAAAAAAVVEKAWLTTRTSRRSGPSCAIYVGRRS